jgi:hypothetical protein
MREHKLVGWLFSSFEVTPLHFRLLCFMFMCEQSALHQLRMKIIPLRTPDGSRPPLVAPRRNPIPSVLLFQLYICPNPNNTVRLITWCHQFNFGGNLKKFTIPRFPISFLGFKHLSAEA